MSQILFTTIYHEARIKLGLTVNEYCIADTIYHLSNNPNSQAVGWCYKTKEAMATDIGLSKKSILSIIEKLIKAGLVEKGSETRFLRTTQAWFDAIIIADKESTPLVKKVHQAGNESTPDLGNESTPYIYKLNNKINNNNSLKENWNENDVRLTDLLYQLIKQNYDFIKLKDEPKAYQEMNRLYRLDGRPYELIEFMIRWSQQDSFWKQNIRSVVKLRKQFDSLMVKAKAQSEQEPKVAVI